MEMWKTAACADGKPIHSTWKRTNLSHILQTSFPQRRRDRQFTHIPTTPAAAKIHPILSYPVWSRQRKNIKKEREYSHRMNREAVLPFSIMESVEKSVFSSVRRDEPPYMGNPKGISLKSAYRRKNRPFSTLILTLF
ncbi:hypothetical protein [Dysosmobacter welbionis]|jgi:hypothetical protein